MTAKSTKLTNFAIRDLLDKHARQYFVIINNDNPAEAYFCFPSQVPEGWEILTSNPSHELEIEYQESEDRNGKIYKQVVGIMKTDSIFV